MAKYDPEEMQRLVEKLQAKAVAAMILYPFQGAALGAIGMFIANGARTGSAMIAGALAGGVIGFEFGRQRAFALKVRAQELLCQKQIEENTRK